MTSQKKPTQELSYYLSLRMVFILPLFFVYLGMLKNKIKDYAKRDQHIEKPLQDQSRIHDVVYKVQIFYQDNNMALRNYRDHFVDNGSEESSVDDKIDPVI